MFAAACVISFVGFGLTVNTASLYWTPIMGDLGVNTSTVSLMSTFSGLAGAVALGVASPLFQKFNLKVFLTIMVVLTAVAFFVSAMATTMAVLYAANLVMGVTKAVAVMLSVPILLGNWFEKRLGLVTGIAGAMTAVGGAVFSPIVANIIESQGWRTAYNFTGIVLLITLLPFTIFVTKLRPTGEQRPWGFTGAADGAALPAAMTGVPAKRAFKSIAFFAFVAIGILLQYAGSLVQHLPTILVENGTTLAIASGVFSFLLLGASVGKFAIGAALDAWKPMIGVGLFTAFAVLGWGGLWLLSGQLPLSVASFAAGMGQAVNLVAAVVLIRNVFGAMDYSKILGPILMCGSLSNAAGVYIHGLVRDATGSYDISFIMNIVIFIVAFGLFGLAINRGRTLETSGDVLVADPADSTVIEADANDAAEKVEEETAELVSATC